MERIAAAIVTLAVCGGAWAQPDPHDLAIAPRDGLDVAIDVFSRLRISETDSPKRIDRRFSARVVDRVDQATSAALRARRRIVRWEVTENDVALDPELAGVTMTFTDDRSGTKQVAFADGKLVRAPLIGRMLAHLEGVGTRLRFPESATLGAPCPVGFRGLVPLLFDLPRQPAAATAKMKLVRYDSRRGLAEMEGQLGFVVEAAHDGDARTTYDATVEMKIDLKAGTVKHLTLEGHYTSDTTPGDDKVEAVGTFESTLKSRTGLVARRMFNERPSFRGVVRGFSDLRFVLPSHWYLAESAPDRAIYATTVLGGARQRRLEIAVTEVSDPEAEVEALVRATARGEEDPVIKRIKGSVGPGKTLSFVRAAELHAHDMFAGRQRVVRISMAGPAMDRGALQGDLKRARKTLRSVR